MVTQSAAALLAGAADAAVHNAWIHFFHVVVRHFQAVIYSGARIFDDDVGFFCGFHERSVSMRCAWACQAYEWIGFRT